MPGDTWFGGHGVDVHSNNICAQHYGCGNGQWQCVELTNRFINAEGFYRGVVWGSGNQWYGNAPSGAFDKHPDGS